MIVNSNPRRGWRPSVIRESIRRRDDTHFPSPLRGFACGHHLPGHIRGFADSRGALCRHPLRGFACGHHLPGHVPGFADSPGALCRHPLRGFACDHDLPGHVPGLRTHARIYAGTRSAGSRRIGVMSRQVCGLKRLAYLPFGESDESNLDNFHSLVFDVPLACF